MSYFIDIVNTTSPLTQIVVENASASGITLAWNGGDTKDDMTIVSSELNFDMLTKTAEDAAFISFFTGDEKKYQVFIKNSDDNAIIWQGFILPDLYSEPYKNGCFFVSFTAVCGLARLKGKYLPDEYYSREKSLIDIYCQILNLTGLELDLYFNPAIENFVNKDWNAIYIDTATFADDKGKKQDAYKILDTLLADTFCVCYQADNRWYIEGINTRHIRKITYEIYDTTTGTLSGTSEYTRLLKQITPLITPVITMIPPYNQITVNHKKTEPSLPKTLSKEENNGWAIVTGVVGKIYASSWMANGGLFAICNAPDYYSIVYAKGFYNGNNINFPQDDTKWISLREKLFITKGQKVKMAFDFKIKRPGITEANPGDMNLWKNPFKYEILFNGVVLYSNFGGEVTDFEKIIFNESAEAKLSIEHIFTEDGLFDIKIYAPPGTVNTNRIEGILIQSADVSVIGFDEEETITDLISGEFTIDKEIDLTYGDDKSGYSEAFRLHKLKEQTTFYNEIEVPILYIDSVNSKLAIVQLDGANLIKENLYTVYKGGSLVNVLNVYYNYNTAEQMVVETDAPLTPGSFFVKKYAIDDVVSSRTHWTQWTDAVYRIENTTYAKTVANIYRRIFNVAHEKLDLEALNAVKFNDLIVFKYVSEKNFFVLNAAWNLDDNKTNLTLGRCYYKDSGTSTEDGNVPPIVLAGDDIYINDSETTASALATAYDPDGYINSQIWTKVVGGFGDVIVTPFDLATTFENLTEDFYTYQIQVTDNDGATATDTLNIIRNKNYTVTLELDSEVVETNTSYPSIARLYKLTLSPELLSGLIVKFTGQVYLVTSISGTYGVDAFSSYAIIKNGAVIETGIGSFPGIATNIVLSYKPGDEIFIELVTSALAGDYGSGDTASASAQLIFSSVEFISGFGVVLGLPITKTQSVGVG
jgi:hypothetical protein